MNNLEEKTSNSKLSLADEKLASGNIDKKPKPKKKKRNLWSVKITIVSLFLAAFISFLSELTASSEHMIVIILLLLFLVLASILSDGIGVAVTSCDITPIMSMASRKVYGAKTAIWLLKNNEKVANICNDVVGDIFGIISGACTAAIVAKIILMQGESWQQWLTIAISSAVAALTIGGKAFMKNLAITNSKEFVMFVARMIAVFNKNERSNKKSKKKSKNKNK